MVAITFIEPGGARRTVNATSGESLRDAAMAAGVEGIVGLCGGYANCGTCHVYVDEADLSRLPAPEEAEEIVLDGVNSERRAGSRLSCQVIAGPALEGLTVTVAPDQM